MAQLAYGAVGAVVGWFIGGPSGAYYGFVAGAAIGGAYEAASADDVRLQGPRLTDLKVQSAGYGGLIPEIFGAFRVTGNMIWFSGIRETATTTEVDAGAGGGGKGFGGGPTTQQTTYTYSVDLAIAVCRGPIAGVRKIWADGRLIYNAGDDADLATLIASNQQVPGLRVYLGSTTQQPSALQEAARGVGNVPGYRGIAYVEFENFQLADFGNRIPNFSFEVVDDGAETAPGFEEIETFNVPTSAGYTSANLEPLRTTGIVGMYHGALFKLNETTGQVIASQIFNPPIGLGGYSWTSYELQWLASNDSEFWTIGRISIDRGVFGTYNSCGLIGFNADLSFRKLIDVGQVAYGSGGNASKCLAFQAGGWCFFTAPGTQNRVHLVNTDNAPDLNPSAILNLPTIYTVMAVTSGQVWNIESDRQRRVFWLLQDSGSQIVSFCRGYGETQNAGGTLLYSYATFVSQGLTFKPQVPFRFDLSNECWVHWEEINPSTSQPRAAFHRVRHPDGVLETIYGADNTSTNLQTFVIIDATFLYYLGSDDKWRRVSFATGLEDATYLSPAVPIDLGGATPLIVTPRNTPVIYHMGGDQNVFATDASFQILEPLARLSKNAVSLQSIVDTICERAGMEPGEWDASALASDSVDGYAITRVAAARAAIDPLMRAYFFDVVESDDVVKFVKRGGAALTTIPFREVAIAGSEEGANVVISRSDELELPRQVTVRFANAAWDYQDDAETVSRQITEATEHLMIECPIAMSPTVAKQIAERVLFTMHANRNAVQFQTSRRFAMYEPTDVVNVVTRAGNAVRVHLRDKREAGNLVRWEGVQEAVEIFTGSQAVGSSGAVSSGALTPTPDSLMVFLDIPIVRDGDSDASLYVAIYAASDSGWTGAALVKSADGGVTYGVVGNVSSEATIGSAVGALPDFGGGNVFDELSTVEVQLVRGTLSSATRAQVLGGANAAVLGDEIIQFRTATLTGTGKYRLSGLLRGRRGTEQHMSTHNTGDRFVLLTVAGMLRPSMTAAEVGIARQFKAVTYGQTEGQAFPESVTNTAAGLKPLAPLRVNGARNAAGDLVIRWTRRTRVDVEWRDSVDAALGELSESYSIDILNGSTVVRTLTSSTPTVTYTAAMAAADFGSPTPSSVGVAVYQVSATVGRGFAASATL